VRRRWAALPRRRLLWLVGFGPLHGYLVWYGDILFPYGVVGVVVLPALSWTVRRQVTVGLALLVVSSLIAELGLAFFDSVPAFILDDVRAHYEPSSVAAEVQAFRSGWLEQFREEHEVRAPGQLANRLLANLVDVGPGLSELAHVLEIRAREAVHVRELGAQVG
jgi:uncharacterized protein